MSKFYVIKEGPTIRLSTVTWIGRVISSPISGHYFKVAAGGRDFNIDYDTVEEAEAERARLLDACELS